MIKSIRYGNYKIGVEFTHLKDCYGLYDPNNKLLDFSDPKLRRQAYESCATKGEVMAGANPEYRNAAYEHLATLLPQID